MGERLLEIKGLKTHFATDEGMVHAVDGVDMAIDAGETLGVVGESGCGKSVTAMTVMKLIAMPPGRIVAGEILWKGRDLVPLSADEMRPIRAKEIAMVFQEPMTSLNPVYTVGDQIVEALRLHRGMDRKAARAEAVRLLAEVGISEPKRRLDEYPHQLSGGMRQRVMIAMALSCEPKLLVADEPTTALDVTIQAQILELLAELQERRGMAVLLITHDLGVVAEVCDRVVVMYAGQVVETGSVYEIFRDPAHPYTRGLLDSLPKVDRPGERLDSIPGTVPNPINWPDGCRFRARCSLAGEGCEQPQELVGLGGEGRGARCWRAASRAEPVEVGS